MPVENIHVQQAKILRSEIKRLRAQALRHGFVAGAEALSLAHEIIELGAEGQTDTGNVFHLHQVVTRENSNT